MAKRWRCSALGRPAVEALGEMLLERQVLSGNDVRAVLATVAEVSRKAKCRERRGLLAGGPSRRRNAQSDRAIDITVNDGVTQINQRAVDQTKLRALRRREHQVGTSRLFDV